MLGEMKMQHESNESCEIGERRGLDCREGLKHKSCSKGVDEQGSDGSPWDSWTRRVRRKLRSRARHIPAQVFGGNSQVTSIEAIEAFSSDPFNGKRRSYHSSHLHWTRTAATKIASTGFNSHGVQKQGANSGLKPHKASDGDENLAAKTGCKVRSQVLKRDLRDTISDWSLDHDTVALNETYGQLVDSQQDSKAANKYAMHKDEGALPWTSSAGYRASIQRRPNSSEKACQEASEGRDACFPKKPVQNTKEYDRVRCPPISGACTNGQHNRSNFSSGKAAELSMTDNFSMPSLLEGRKCGLCGCGSNGELSKDMVLELGSHKEFDLKESDKGVTASHMVQNVAAMQETSWLGRLLGPLSDRIGVAGVWVHQQCAIWSPEVYFLGVGRLKNVQVALRRGRYLKCNRCSQPGATIGCRVDRCPRTYHLPCARLEGCSFDHEKYLMACVDHLRLFRRRRRKEHKSSHDSFQVCYDDFKNDGKYNLGCADVRSNSFADSACLLKSFKDEKWIENAGEDVEFVKREKKRLRRDLARLAPTFLGGTVESDANAEGWESVAGSHDVIECLKEMVILPLLYPENFRALGIVPPKGVLLHGHPGTGKTHVVRALAGACARGKQKVAYFFRKGADCLGKYVGDSERQLRLLFQMAEWYQPSIIFFDEIDGLAPKRSQHQDQTHCSVVSTLLALMDGLMPRGSVIVIGATNRPDALDPALRRPGRFDREVNFPLPSTQDRAAIVTLLTKKWAKTPSRTLTSEVANQTSGFAGADLQALCTQTVLMALKRLYPLKHLLNSVGKQTKPGELPALPDIQVKAVDWVAALLNVSPPCSRRMASRASSEVSVAPLAKHVVPVLLHPLVQILIFLDQDGRFFFPPLLTRTISLLETALRHASTQVINFADPNSMSHLNQCCSKTSVARRLKYALAQGGLVADAHTIPAEECLFPNQKNQYGSSDTTDLAKQLEHRGEKWKGSKFRMLITGNFKHGQNLLASCFLQGFQGAAQLRLLSLHTMIQAGSGDTEQGLIHIVAEAKSVAPCVIFISHLDSWAFQQLLPKELQELNCEAKSNVSVLRKQNCSGTETWVDTAKCLDEGSPTVTTLWNLLIQQIQMLPQHVSVMILATSAVSSNKLPHEILSFFGHSQGPRAAKCQTVPSICLQLPMCNDFGEVLELASQNISEQLAKHFVESIRLSFKEENESSHAKEQPSMKSVKAKCGDSLQKDVDTYGCLDCVLSVKRKCAEAERPLVQEIPLGPEDTILKSPSKAVKGLAKVEATKNLGELRGQQESVLLKSTYAPPSLIWSAEREALSTAIRLCGSQLLRYQKFAALRLATRKLKAGPSIALAEPFTICTGGNSKRHCAGSAKSPGELSADFGGIEEEKVAHSTFWGLTAVGLKAYKGLYTTASNVAVEIGIILDILHENINERVNSGKDECRYFHLMRQAAALQDMVSSWAHDIQRLEKAAKVPSSLLDGKAGLEGSDSKHATAVEASMVANNNNFNNMSEGHGINDFMDGGSQPSMLDALNRLSQQQLCSMVSQAKLDADTSQGQPAEFEHYAKSDQAGEPSKSPHKTNYVDIPTCGEHVIDSRDSVQIFQKEMHESQHSKVRELGVSTSVVASHCERHESFSAGEPGMATRKYGYSLRCLEYLKLSIRQVLVSLCEEDGCLNAIEAINDVIGDFTAMAFSRLRKLETSFLQNEFCGFSKESVLQTSLDERMLTCRCLESFTHIKAAKMKLTPLHFTEVTKTEICRLNMPVDMESTVHDHVVVKGEGARCTESVSRTVCQASAVDGKACDLILAGNLCLSPIIKVISSMSILKTS